MKGPATRPGTVDDAELAARVREVLATLEQSPLPVGGFRRLMSLGGLHASVLGSYALDWLGGFFRSADARERRRAEVHLHAALQVLSRMGYLRGLVMKLGQALGSYPDVVPEVWMRVLGRLQWEAPPMHYSLIREQLVAELGGEPDEIFAEFDRRAFAAASLGQVHRARLHSGEEVAVKIQYPGIARTIEVDLANLRALMQPLRLAFEWEALRSVIDDLATVAVSESDYLSEATFHHAARDVLDGHPSIRVPQVFDEYTTSRVIVTGLARGRHLDAWLETDPPQDVRDRMGERIFEAQFRLVMAARLLYPDFNAGNILFGDDGVLTLLDFGNMRQLTGGEVAWMRSFNRALESGDDDDLATAAMAGALIPPERMSSEVRTAVVEFARWTAEPLRQRGPFEFGSDFWHRGLDLFIQSIRIRFVQFVPLMAHFCRAAYSSRALLTRMGARSDVGRVNRQLEAEFPAGGR